MVSPLFEPVMSYRRALECLLGVPVTERNRIEVLGDGDRVFEAMQASIHEARTAVDLSTFGCWSGSVGAKLAAALAERARSGVSVRVLLDALGRRHMDRTAIATMERAGVTVVWFRPLTNWRVTQSTHRGHRNVLVCDNEVAYTGSIGIADHWRGPHAWRDLHLRVRGPAVNGLRGAFVNNWAETGMCQFEDEVTRLPPPAAAGESWAQVVMGDAETGWGDLSTLVRALIGMARQRLRIVADHFVPDADCLALLCDAARRGVEVELMRSTTTAASSLSERASQAAYGPLLEAGARVWAYELTVLHTKVITVDGAVASVGSVNFDARSLTLDDEVCLVVLDPAVVEELDARFEADRRQCRSLDLGWWVGRGASQRVGTRALAWMARAV